jgi:hypothetical protein
MNTDELFNVEMEKKLLIKYKQMISERYSFPEKWNRDQIEAMHNMLCALYDYRLASED